MILKSLPKGSGVRVQKRFPHFLGAIAAIAALTAAKSSCGAPLRGAAAGSQARCEALPRMRDEAPRGVRSGKTAQAIPLLSSRPGAKAQIYIDLDGETVTHPDWNRGQTIVAPGYDLSAAEIAAIFERVKEDFAPFDVNVTTDLSKFLKAPASLRMRCIVTSNDSFRPNSGGVAYLNSFGTSAPCWVFNSSVVGISEAVSHEVGHTLGLEHDGRTSPREEYYYGHSSPGALGWAPIMGASYYEPLSQWSRGEYTGANNSEDDLAKILSNGFGLVPDEAGKTRDTAAALSYKSPGIVSAKGLITSAGDTDYFAFSTSGGAVSLRADGAAPSPNLDIGLQLEDGSGKVLAAAKPNDKTSAEIALNLAAGTYFLRVVGTGMPAPPATGSTNYSSLGAYFLAGTIPGGIRRSAQTVLLSPLDRAGVAGNFPLRAKVSGDAKISRMVFDARPLPDTSSRAPKLAIKPGTVGSDSLSIASFAGFQTASLTLDLEFAYDALRSKVTLIAPDGNRIAIYDAVAEGYGMDKTFDLSNALRGKSRGGKWRLEISSSGNTYSSALLNAWSLSFGSETWTPIATDSDGANGASEWTATWPTASLLSGKYEVRATPAVAVTDAAAPDINTDISVSGFTPPTLSMGDISIAEGNSGSKTGAFTLSLSKASALPVSLRYLTGQVLPAISANALAGKDYTALSAKTLTFAPGETRKTVAVSVLGDTLDEEDEKFALLLDKGSNLLLPDTLGVATILDDDSAPSLGFTSSPATEGRAGSSVVFDLKLSAPSARPVSLKYQTFNAPAPVATAGLDYQPLTSTILTFEPGQTSKRILVPVYDDLLDEENERVGLKLSSPSNVTIPVSSFDGLILDNDALPSIQNIDTPALSEGNEGRTQVNFTLRLSAPSGRAVTVNYAPALLEGGAVSPADFEAFAPRIVRFNPGETEKTVQVAVLGDTLDEADETFGLTLNDPINASLGDNNARATILNDDSAPGLQIGDASAIEGNDLGGVLSFHLTLSAPSGREVTVELETLDRSGEGGAATPNLDYAPLGRTAIRFAPGETQKTVDVAVQGDALNEVDEVLTLSLLSFAGATPQNYSAQGTIVNDDSAPSLSIQNLTVSEGNETTEAVFTVTLSAPSGQNVSVDYATEDSSAQAGSDFGATSGTLKFAPGEVTKTFSVTIVGDSEGESDENFRVRLLNAAGASLAVDSATGTIFNDDSAPVLGASPASKPESSAGNS